MTQFFQPNQGNRRETSASASDGVYMVISSFKTNDPGEHNIFKDEYVKVGGWLKRVAEKAGFPHPFCEVCLQLPFPASRMPKMCRATRDWHDTEKGAEICFNKGDMLEVIQQAEGDIDLWMVRKGHMQGWVSSSYFKRAESGYCTGSIDDPEPYNDVAVRPKQVEDDYDDGNDSAPLDGYLEIDEDAMDDLEVIRQAGRAAHSAARGTELNIPAILPPTPPAAATTATAAPAGAQTALLAEMKAKTQCMPSNEYLQPSQQQQGLVPSRPAPPPPRNDVTGGRQRVLLSPAVSNRPPNQLPPPPPIKSTTPKATHTSPPGAETPPPQKTQCKLRPPPPPQKSVGAVHKGLPLPLPQAAATPPIASYREAVKEWNSSAAGPTAFGGPTLKDDLHIQAANLKPTERDRKQSAPVAVDDELLKHLQTRREMIYGSSPNINNLPINDIEKRNKAEDEVAEPSNQSVQERKNMFSQKIRDNLK